MDRQLRHKIACDFEHHVLDLVGGKWNDKVLHEGEYIYAYTYSDLHRAYRDKKMKAGERVAYETFLADIFPGRPSFMSASATLLYEVKKMSQ